MSSDYSGVEQDRAPPNGQNELPTYDDLAAQNGPNSRFGRWRGWIEKRAAERYLDVSPDERMRRKQRGWGNDEMDPRNYGGLSTTVDQSSASPPSLSQLSIQTEDLPAAQPSSKQCTPTPTSLNSSFISKRLSPTRLKINQFGSRFLPHATSPIRCLLPLESDRLLLIGHDDGLSVLDMYPKEWSEDGGIVDKGPDEAHARSIWEGESVLQMSLLEIDSTEEGATQGVLLALVESDASNAKDADTMRSLRMYNLASLISLAKWAIAHKGARPVDLHRPSNWQVQQSPKRPRPQSSAVFARGLKSLIDHPTSSHSQEFSGSSYDRMFMPTSSKAQTLTPTRVTPRRSLTPNRRKSTESSWDVVDDLPLRWATDFVPLATNGSRLSNVSVTSYALWCAENFKGRGGHMLVISTKNNILLYETPRGERAFRFVKEFYTPLQPRSMKFFYQSVNDVGRRSSDIGTPKQLHSHRRTDSSSTTRAATDPNSRVSTSSVATINYGTHLSIFVVFDKKAGWIRLADAAVGEIDLYDFNDGHQLRPSDSSSTSSLLSRMSFEAGHHHHTPRWIEPVSCTLPIPNKLGVTRDVYLLTRGKLTHILPYPLPIDHLSYPPLFAFTWRSAPTSVSARVYRPSAGSGHSPSIQLIALGGEYGVEVQEMSLSFLERSGGKGKARQLEEPLRVEDDQGGDTGFLCNGGYWDQSQPPLSHSHPGLDRSNSAVSAVSANSYISMETEELLETRRQEVGLYAWCRKGLEDWRVFWLGGSWTGNGDQDNHET